MIKPIGAFGKKERGRKNFFLDTVAKQRLIRAMEEVEYCIKVIPWHRWRGDYGWNYSEDLDNEYELTANSIEELYEAVARDYNQWVVKAEDAANKKNCSECDRLENKGIKYSDIYIVVEPYSEEKRNATKAYQEVGKVRDAFIANKKAKEEAERIRVEAYRKQKKEENDRKEWARLKKIYGNG